MIELRDEAKTSAPCPDMLSAFDRCPACGHGLPQRLLGDIDPKALAAGVIVDLEKVREAQAWPTRKSTSLKVK